MMLTSVLAQLGPLFVPPGSLSFLSAFAIPIRDPRGVLALKGALVAAGGSQGRTPRRAFSSAVGTGRGGLGLVWPPSWTPGMLSLGRGPFVPPSLVRRPPFRSLPSRMTQIWIRRRIIGRLRLPFSFCGDLGFALRSPLRSVLGEGPGQSL